MTSAALLSDRRARLAVSVAFFLAGAIFGNWVPRIPDVKADLDLTNAALGAALLGLAIGSLVAMQISGYAMSRWGTRVVVRLFAPLFAVSLLAVPLFGRSAWSLGAALLLVGAMNGALDIAMNGQGVAVERRYRRPLINSMHALFSLGGVSGALTGGLAASHDVSLTVHAFIVAVVGVALSLATSHWLLSPADERSTVPTAAPGTTVTYRQLLTVPTLIMGALALCAFLSEGGIYDWVTVYMQDSLFTSPALAATAFGAFQGVMTVVRLVADRAVAKWGAVRVLRVNTAVGAVGLAIGLLTGHPLAAVAGFALAGLGTSVVVPLLFSAAGHAPSPDPSRTLTIVSTCGFFGFFVGPPLFGAVADLTSLTVTLFIPVVLLLVISFNAKIVRGASGTDRPTSAAHEALVEHA